MFAKHGLWIALAVLVGWTEIAAAQVSITPATIDVGNVPIGSTGSDTGSLSTASAPAETVDVALTTCSVVDGSGSFDLSAPGGLTGLSLNSAKTITVTYTAMTAGTRTCNVEVRDSGDNSLLLTFQVTATGTAPVIGTTPSTTHPFGAVRFNNNAIAPHTATVTLFVTNDGDADLVVDGIAPSGGQAGDYSVAGTFPETITAGNTASFTVTFNPQVAGPSATTLQITSNDPVTPIKPISLSGTGSTAVIAIGDAPFGVVNVGGSSTQNITIANSGTGTRGVLRVDGAAFAGNSAGWFKLGGSCSGSTTACTLSLDITNTAATLPVTCSPPANATGTQNATVTFTSDSDSTGDAVAVLSCTAGRADMTVVQTPLAFGDQLINATSTAQTVKIDNTGNVALTYSLSLVGTDPTQFTVTGASGCTSSCSLAAGGSVNVSVAFRPTTAGAKSASLRVTAANDPDTTSLDVPLTGNGVAPISTPSATSLAFGSIDVGSTSTGQTLTVTNTGTYPLTISAAFLQTGAAEYAVTGTTGTSVSITVQPTQTASWTIACKPTAMGSRPGTFRLTSNTNGTAGTSQDISLTCTGLQGVLAFLTPPANPFDFGGVRENETRTQTFTLRNNGNTTVSNIAVAFTGTGTGYTVTPTTIASLAAGATATVTATFAPLSGNDGGTYIATYTGSWGTAKSAAATLTLNGDGLTTGYDTVPSSPNALDFASIRFDQTKVMPVSVVNTAGTPLKILGFTITPGTALTGEFTVTRCLKNSVPLTCPTASAPYNSSGVNDTLVVEVTMNPADRVAMMDATLTIASDLPTNPNRTVPLKGNAISAGMSIDPTSLVLDFGPVDLDATPVTVTRTVMLTNTGAAPLDFTSVTKTGARFALSATPAPTTLQPNGTYTITVSYTPTAEKPSNQPDTGTIVFGGVAGVFGSPSTITIQLSGYGIDRHISVAPAPTFPDTYKNPGADAPVRPVTITNMGDATLNVSAVMVTNEPIWTLVNADPVTVPGRGTHDFDVKFAPTSAGKAPTGQLTIMNNDNGMPLVTVDLDGNGIARNVMVGPTVIDLGYVGIGMTAKLSAIARSEVLAVSNIDTTMFSISKVDVTGGDGAFRVTTLAGAEIDPANPMPLAPSETQTFDVAFTPSYEGDFEATAIVYLGDDPQQPVTLRGRGLFVDTGGGGGCSTTRGGAGGGLALIFVALAVVLGRGRRQRRHARELAAATVVGTLGVIATAQPARADQTRNVSLPLFDPTPTAGTQTTFHVQGAEVAEAGSLGMFALVSYASRPLVLRTAQNDAAAVDSRTTLELGGAYALGMLELGARMPFYLQSGDALPTPEQRREMFGVEPAGTARGDLTLHAKLQLGARGGFAYGVAAAITAPTATDEQFAGNDMPTGRAQLLLSLVRGPLTMRVNAGGVVRQQAQVGSAIQRSGAVFGGALSLRVLDSLWLAGELYGELMPGGQTAAPAMGEPMGVEELGKPIEGLFGLRYQMGRTTNLGLAVGRGVTSDMGSPALRGVLMLAYTPSAEALRPLHPPRPPEPERDTDGDGINDKVDGCPNEPEDKDLYDDADGCPDLDNDGDGIADTADKCPLDAEDMDGFQDGDGCPDKDNDGDGVPDELDKCPLAAEDRDGFEDTDGCPDNDNDGDGLIDSVDKCPNEPETINGNADDDGCPDKGNSLVVVSPDRLETMEAVSFAGSKIARASHNVLGQVGATLRAHPEILRVRVTVHVNPTSNAGADKSLSEQRAKAVREWLVEWGIDPLRLQVAGFGGTKPLVPATQRGAKEINDRVELIILERQ